MGCFRSQADTGTLVRILWAVTASGYFSCCCVHRLLPGVSSKTAFVVGLIRGLGSNLNLKKRSQFAKEVFSWANERPPDISAPLDCTANPTSGRLESFVTPNYDGALSRLGTNHREGCMGSIGCGLHCTDASVSW